MKITNRWTQALLFESDHATIKGTLLAALVSGADLSGANLSGADLSGANLSVADLSGADLGVADLSVADLSDADLSDANLSVADLSGADLSGADLSDANLSGADLRGANLSDANLSDADLSGADLSGANLSVADLSGADLSGVRDDVWAVLSAAPHEAQGLLDAIMAGKINGSAYEGECACLVGTIAKIKGVRYDAMPLLVPNARRAAEVWFLQIAEGDTPETSQASKFTAEWVSTWLSNMRAAFGSESA